MRYTHYSHKLFDFNKNFQYNRLPGFLKPVGFWYGVETENEDSWKDWCTREEQSNLLGEFEYEVEIDFTNVLILDTLDKLKEFNEIYSLHKQFYTTIDWPLAMSKYDGIQIAPHFYQIRLQFDFFWYSGWDCASGCIWNLEAIKSVKLIS